MIPKKPLITTISLLMITLLLLGAAGTAPAEEIYSWVDGNGVRHFSDSSPQGQVHDQYAVEVEKPAPKAYHRHRLYHIEDGNGYCGHRRLPSEKEEDPRQKLVNLLFARKSTTAQKKRLEMDLRRNEENRSNSNSTYHERLEYSLEECECLLSWIDHELEGLEGVKDRILMEARQAEYKHEEAQRECGPEPPYNGPTDPEVIRWVECTNKNMHRRNRLLKEKKASQRLEENLVKALEQE